MKKILFFLLLTFMLLCCACSFNYDNSYDTIAESDINKEADTIPHETKLLSEQKKELVKMYSATLFNDIIDSCDYSIEIVDNYSGTNICLENAGVIDMFYKENEKYISLDYAYSNDYTFILKITDEQYEFIKSLDDDDLFEPHYDMCVYFTLNNITSNQPSVYGSFDFYVDYNDLCLNEEDCDVFFDLRIIEGTLLDIIEISNAF